MSFYILIKETIATSCRWQQWVETSIELREPGHCNLLNALIHLTVILHALMEF